ncbi:PilC/PilY family type IV pilus protein [Frateuria defendens]|uniref:PilC/PilY family type IV pilus protein n=1 Tax=Frateuria defendens TaxID=2219559 RepID=UPI0007DC1221|nr:PilC/PilY family type IV pilus protein [Frateuria defendens]
MSTKHVWRWALVAGLWLAQSAAAVTYTENFSGASSSLKWRALDYACLTAGDGTGSIPACASSKDDEGAGALRLTPAENQRTGAILSDFTFPLSQGMQVTFTTYTYGGDSGGLARDGADGIAFFLTDGTQTIPTTAGGSGGSLGYSCSNVNGKSEGIAYGYLGLGVDEFGNYLNIGDNTNSGVLNSNNSGDTSNGTNSYYDSRVPFYQPGRIGLRGAGNVTWAWLHAENPSYYGDQPDSSKVHDACRSGQYVYQGSDKASGNMKALPYNYPAIAGGYQVMPDDQPIANESTSVRSGATPITYKLQISTSGLLNFFYSYNNGAFTPVLVNNSIAASNGPLPASFRFGFSAGTGGSNNVHEITCFQATPLQSNSSSGANTVQSGEVKIGTQIYLASYSADNWWGSLQSIPLVVNNGVLSASSVANWDAKCVLTGGGCASMGTDDQGNPTNTVDVQKPDARMLLTADASGKGLALEWNSLTASQQNNLNSKDSQGQQRLDWLRGDRSDEQLQNASGTLRNRTAVLGDIIDSSPTWVGAPVPGVYPDAFGDALYGNNVKSPENGSAAQTYSNFVTSNATRLNVVYVGGNDGLMHGFRAGSYTDTGSYNSTNNDGHEVLGFMPGGVLASPEIVGLTSPTYSHNYFVDATPAAGDLFYGGKWHTWLAGGVGTGGSEIFALDISDPSIFSESMISTVIGDWTSRTSGFSHLGKTVGTPIFTRLHNGQWAIIFGSGLSSSQSAGVYVGMVDATSGALTFKFLDTGIVSGGITYATSVDLDGDYIADFLYAGDLKGNVWRFDVTDNKDAKWGAPTRVFTAKDAIGNAQPITTAPVVAAVKMGDVSRVMVYFGTGQKSPFTSTSGDTYATGTQTFYGIWDSNMDAWNQVAGSSAQYASLSGSQVVVRDKLLSQTVSSTSTGGGSNQVLGYRYLSTTKQVCWVGSTACSTDTSQNTQYGWYFDFPETGEQIIYNPALISGAVVVSSAIPPAISALKCNPGLQSGWTMAFDPTSGGGMTQDFFPGAGGGFGTGTDGSSIGGIRLDAVGSPSTVTYGGQTYLVTQTVKGTAALSQVNPPASKNPSRVSWKEIRY